MRRYVPILAYHKVGAHQGDHVPTVAPEAFEKQMAFLSRFRYQVWPIERLSATLAAGDVIPPRVTAITFDDGYVETCTIAWPQLKRYGFPAAVFISTAEVGLPGFATWAQLRAMAREGFTVGSHTVHHTYIPKAAGELLQVEFLESKRRIEQELGRAADYLSYPIGGFTQQAQQLARDAGYRAAFTTNRAYQRRTLDLYAVRRIKMTDKDVDPLRLWAKLSGYYDLFRRLPAPA